MRIDPNVLRKLLVQENPVAGTDELWLNYFKFYALDDITAHYKVEIGLLQQQSFYQHYRQPQCSIGTCIIVHGYMDHSAIYRHLIADRLAAGWDVLIYDKIGHGLSSGESYAITSFSDYASQLQTLLEYLAVRCTKQWLLIGQSTGAAVVMEHALNPVYKRFDQIVQRVLLAPLVRSFRFNSVKIQYYLLRLFIKSVRRANSNNSHDPVFLDFMQQQDPLARRRVKVSWVGAMLSWEQVFHAYPKSMIELMVIQGDDDETVDWRYNLKAIKHTFPHSQHHVIAGGKHHLVNEGEQWREQVFALVALND